MNVHPTEGSSPDEPDLHEADTGPLHVSKPTQPDDGWGPAPDTWAARFDAPLTVNPRQVQDNRRPIVFFGIVAVVVIVAVGGLIWWLTRPSDGNGSAAPSANQAPSSSASSEADADTKALMRLLPAGYPAGSCKPVTAPKGVVAQVNCDTNSDPGGPTSATYSLVKDKARWTPLSVTSSGRQPESTARATSSRRVPGVAMPHPTRPVGCSMAVFRATARRSPGPMTRGFW